jgi:hypothetical protein
MTFLDLYPEQDAREASPQPNEGTSLPSGFGENFHAAWNDGLLFSQSVARDNARAGVLGDYIDEIRQKTGQDLSNEIKPDAAEGTIGPSMFDQANARVAKLKQDYPDLDLNPLSEDEIDKRAVAKAQAAHRTYETLQAGEKTWEGSVGSFFGGAFAGAADPINIVGMAVAPEAAGIGILSSALRWGALAGVSQAAIEFQSDQFKEQVHPGYTESGAPLHEIAGAFAGGALLGGGIKALGNAWTRVKTGNWPTSVRDAGNVIESEANVAQTNIFPGVEGEVAHREALTKTIDDILAGRPVDVGAQITPELQQAAVEAERSFPHEPGYELHSAGDIVHIRSGGLPVEIISGEWKGALGGTQVPEYQVRLSDGKETTMSGAMLAEKSPLMQQLPLDFEAPAIPKIAKAEGPQPVLQTADEMNKTLAAPDHQDAIRADIDRARAMGDVQVPGVDENGNHTMVGVDAAMDQVDAYKALSEHIQACANPVQEAAE